MQVMVMRLMSKIEYIIVQKKNQTNKQNKFKDWVNQG